MVVDEGVDVAAVLLLHEVGHDGHHVLTAWHDVLLALAGHVFRAVVELDPAPAPVVYQGRLDHVRTVDFDGLGVQYDSVEVLDGVDAGQAVVLHAQRHDAQAQRARVLEGLGRRQVVAAVLHEVVQNLVLLRLAGIERETEEAVLVHDALDVVVDDVDRLAVPGLLHEPGVSGCPLSLPVQEGPVVAHAVVVLVELRPGTVAEVDELVDYRLAVKGGLQLVFCGY